MDWQTNDPATTPQRPSGSPADVPAPDDTPEGLGGAERAARELPDEVLERECLRRFYPQRYLMGTYGQEQP